MSEWDDVAIDSNTRLEREIKKLRIRLAAAEEQQDIAAWNWGKCESELAAARRALEELTKFAKSIACGSEGVNEDGSHQCVHHYDDPIAERRCFEARALLAPERPREERG